MSTPKTKKNTSPRQTTTTSGAKLPQFVSCELTDDEKAKLKENILSSDECVDLIQELQDVGYRIAISHDSRSDCVGVYVTATDPDHENSGYALSARGPNLSACLTVLSFKHFHKLGEDWRSGAGADNRDSWG